MKLKVLHILNSLEFSGAEIMLKTAAPLLMESGIETHILSTGKQIGNYAGELEKAGFTIRHLPFRKSPAYFINLYKMLRFEKYSVLHIHPERAFVWHALTGKLAGVPRILRTIHSVFLFKGWLRIKKLIARKFASVFLKVKFIAVSDSVEEVERNNFSNPTVKIYNWIDEKVFYPPVSSEEKQALRKKLGLREDSFIMISVGSCQKIKRHGLIIQSLNRISGQAPRLVYLHLGEGNLLEEEKETADVLGLTDRIVFAGNRNNVRDYLAASDIFVMMSEYEGMPIALLEAVTCGLPCVVNDTYGLKDLVENGVNGYLIKNNAELDEKILKFYNSKELCNEFSNHIINKFSMINSLKMLYEIYLK